MTEIPAHIQDELDGALLDEFRARGTFLADLPVVSDAQARRIEAAQAAHEWPDYGDSDPDREDGENLHGPVIHTDCDPGDETHA